MYILKGTHGVSTRFCSACMGSVAPRSRAYGVVGLDLNLVLGPGIQALYCGFSRLPCSIHVLGSVLASPICPPHTQPVSHSLWVTVILRLWKRLQGKTEWVEKKNDQKVVFCLFFCVTPTQTYGYPQQFTLRNHCKISLSQVKLCGDFFVFLHQSRL